MTSTCVNLQAFLDSCYSIIKVNPPEARCALLFFSIDLLKLIETNGLLSEMSHFQDFEKQLPGFCMKFARRLLLGDFYFSARPIPRFRGNEEFDRIFTPAMLYVLVSSNAISTKSRALDLMIKTIGDNPDLLEEAKILALRFGKKAENIEDMNAFVAAVCKTVLYKYT